ncbi:isocitrate/isopropylmalate dehydrogenase [Bartonella fuyuanensis]|uniref:Isocitrate/isopropylmalate dehydrogenase n=1 Tax=Bartonella fuyuanensis TaxID=1460968 RepID=A0A840E2I0_9HYPH|nr:isocitrate/isopropylmalate dehydrogenase [Bartonella fuyuanensis]
MKKKVLVLPGDGVGAEVCDAALVVLEQFQLLIELAYGRCWLGMLEKGKRYGSPNDLAKKNLKVMLFYLVL